MAVRDYASEQAQVLNAAKQQRDNPSVASAIDAAGRARQSLNALAEMAEGIRDKLAGPHPHGVSEGETGPSAPRSVVEQLHFEVRGMTDPLTRIEFALRDIDARIG